MSDNTIMESASLADENSANEFIPIGGWLMPLYMLYVLAMASSAVLLIVSLIFAFTYKFSIPGIAPAALIISLVFMMVIAVFLIGAVVLIIKRSQIFRIPIWLVSILLAALQVFSFIAHRANLLFTIISLLALTISSLYLVFSKRVKNTFNIECKANKANTIE